MGIALPDARLLMPELLLGRKPVGPVVIDWDHPQARGLVMFTSPNFKKDMVSGNYINLRGNISIDVGSKGKQLSSTDTSDNSGYFSGSPKLYRITNKVTLFWYGRIDALASYAGLVSIPSFNNQWAAPYASLGLHRSSTTNIKIHYAIGSTPKSAEFAPDFDTGEGFYLATINTSTGAAVLYKNGVQIDTATGTGTGSINWNTNNDVVINCSDRYGYDTSALDGSCYIAGIYNRILSAFEVNSFNKNPYQFLKPRHY